MNFDEKMMKKCFSLAKKAGLKTYKNPLVGAVLCSNDGKILHTGYHKKYGEAHAEANLINSYKGDFKDTTLYVNLEPCSHHGKTPPCANLIIEKGIKKVVVAMVDPNPKVNNKGIELLNEGGVEVKVGILEEEAKELNRVFIKNITYKKPYIVTKIATTMDGKIATLNKTSKWITGEKSRKFVRKLRDSVYGILTASGTVLSDNPSLKGKKNKPARIILDKRGEIPFDYKVFENDGAKIYYVTNSKRIIPNYIERIEFTTYNNLFETLYEKGILSIMTEGGAGINSELIDKGEIDYIYQFIAPKICGEGISYSDKIKITDINLSKKINIKKISKFDNDILIEGNIVK